MLQINVYIGNQENCV